MAQTIVSSSFTDNRMTLAVAHTSHGFTDPTDIGKAVRSSGTDGQFIIARANNAVNSEVVGIITSIEGVNNYTITTSGFVDVVAAVPTATAGTVFFLAEADDSQLTSTEPTTLSAVSKPVAVVTESNAKMLLIHYRGEVIASSVTNTAPNDANYLIGTANSSLSAEIVVGTVPGGELGNTWASPTVDSSHSGSAHHAEAHTVVSHSDTTATGAELETLTDGSTTALHVHAIANDSVTLAKMAGGTDGNLITYDTSGNPAYVVTGTATHVLTSNGADTVPTFQAAAGGDLSFGGDTFGADKIIGSNDAYALSFETAGVVRMKIHGQVTDPTSAGAITMPTQPAVFALNDSNENNVTGNGSPATARLNSEVYDQGGDFNNSTYAFTAPVTGRYHISACLAVSGMTTSATAFLVQLVTSNRVFVPVQGGSVPANGSYHWPLSVDADMDVNDTVYMRFYVYGMGSDTVDIRGDGSEVETFMTVRLVA
jgi:hypothetical protein